jgi:hypothetical protein
MLEIGQRVVCIHVDPSDPVDGGFAPNRPYVGMIYTIRKIGLFKAGDPWEAPGLIGERYFPQDAYGFCLVEIVNPPHPTLGEVHFWAHWFRPVKETNISIFKKMLAPVPETIQ